MPKKRPRCHCGGDMKRNGITSSGKTRWRCTVCGASVTKTRSDISKAAVFRTFIDHCTSTTALTQTARSAGVSHSTMKRRFTWCWFVEVPDPTIGHNGRVYDQIFLDGTYTCGGCLIVAATLDHVLAWHWCTHETTHNYQQLLQRIPAPKITVIDGDKALPARSQSAGQPPKSNAASSTHNASYVVTPPHDLALTLDAQSTN